MSREGGYGPLFIPRRYRRCFYCRRPLQLPGASPDGRTRDHIFPRAMLRRLGIRLPDEWHALNVVPCCAGCNQTKADMHPEAWLRVLDRHTHRQLLDRLDRLKAMATGIPGPRC